MVNQCSEGDIMSKITKNIGYAILWLNYKNKDITQISKELKLTTSQVSTFLEKNNTINKPGTGELPVKQSPVKKSKDLMIMHTRDKKTNNVAIMTREASEFNDHVKQKLRTSTNNKSNYIFKPNERK